MEYLAPCPYCGGEAHHTTYKHPYMSCDTERHNIECMDCGAEAGYGDSTGGLSWTTKEAAYKQWNTRVEAEQVTQLGKDKAELLVLLRHLVNPHNEKEDIIRIIEKAEVLLERMD